MADLIITLLIAGAGLWLPLLLLVRLQVYALARLRPAAWMPFAIAGVPVHEASHALACLAFRTVGHKIQRIEFFKPDKSGTLGFVEYSYRPGLISWFANLVVGIAPLFGGALTIWLITYYLAPELLTVTEMEVWQHESVVLSVWSVVSGTFSLITTLPWANPLTWLWLYLSVSIAMFMVPSLPDFQGAAKGIVATCLGLLLLAVFAPQAALHFVTRTTEVAYLLYPLWVFAIGIFLSLSLLGSILSLIRKTGVKPTL